MREKGRTKHAGDVVKRAHVGTLIKEVWCIASRACEFPGPAAAAALCSVQVYAYCTSQYGASLCLCAWKYTATSALLPDPRIYDNKNRCRLVGFRLPQPTSTSRKGGSFHFISFHLRDQRPCKPFIRRKMLQKYI